MTGAAYLLQNLGSRTVALADKGYDGDWIRAQIKAQGATANIPNKSNRKALYSFRKKLYRQRNLIERFFNKLKQVQAHCNPIRQAQGHVLRVHPARCRPDLAAIN